MSRPSSSPEIFEVAIIGGGPAGLSAALLLGRCRRRTLVIDSGKPRNAKSRGLHGFLTRDGTPPAALRRLGRAQLRPYRTVSFRDALVASVRRTSDGFALTLSNRSRIWCQRLLLATGREDLIPDKPGFSKFFGRGVYHCPICDGWEHRNETIAVYSPHGEGVDIALELRTWTSNVTMCTDGPVKWRKAVREKLRRYGVGVDETRVMRLEGRSMLSGIRFADGSVLACTALFFCSACRQRSRLPARLGCKLDLEGSVMCDGHAATGIPGLYVAGNVRGGLHLAIMAAAEGADAAIAINDDLIDAGIFPSDT